MANRFAAARRGEKVRQHEEIPVKASAPIVAAAPKPVAKTRPPLRDGAGYLETVAWIAGGDAVIPLEDDFDQATAAWLAGPRG